MRDRLLKNTETSIAKYLQDTTGIQSYIVTPEFDWNVDPQGLNWASGLIGVRFIQSLDRAVFCDAARTIDPRMTFIITCAASTFKDVREYHGDIVYQLRNATFTASGVGFYYEGLSGLPLYNFDFNPPSVISGFNIDFEDYPQDDANPSGPDTAGKLKYSINIGITLSPVVKDVSKELL